MPGSLSRALSAPLSARQLVLTLPPLLLVQLLEQVGLPFLLREEESLDFLQRRQVEVVGRGRRRQTAATRLATCCIRTGTGQFVVTVIVNTVGTGTAAATGDLGHHATNSKCGSDALWELASV